MLIKDTKKLLLIGTLAVGFMTSVEAAPVYSTFLTVSNNNSWTDGQNFAEVTINSIDVGGGDFDFMFTVDLCADITSSACAVGQDIEQFGFNVMGSIALTSGNFDFASVSGWGVDFAPPAQTLDGFGGFDVQVFNNSSGQQPLTFTITGVTGDSIATYATDLSTGGQPNAGQLFAAKVSAGAQGAFIAGGSPVPVPAALWLFGSGLIGLVAVSRRKA